MIDTLGRLPRQVLVALLRGYRLLLSPWLGSSCRFYPTCSVYTIEALQRHGAWRGSALGGWRLLRCQPWCDGGCDPVPETFPNPAAGLFARLGLLAGPDPLPTLDPAAVDPRPPTRNLP
jgi:hypothetical protein